MTTEQRPSVGRIVHYVRYGTPGGEYPATCRAAIITGLGEPLLYPTPGPGVDDLGEDGAQLADLCVLNPTGMFFKEGLPQDERPTTAVEAGDGGVRQPGTWHWPERV
jgi:hypothetical protein